MWLDPRSAGFAIATTLATVASLSGRSLSSSSARCARGRWRTEQSINRPGPRLSGRLERPQQQDIHGPSSRCSFAVRLRHACAHACARGLLELRTGLAFGSGRRVPSAGSREAERLGGRAPHVRARRRSDVRSHGRSGGDGRRDDGHDPRAVPLRRGRRGRVAPRMRSDGADRASSPRLDQRRQVGR